MKTVVQRANDRGKGYYGWLRTHYSFSFANYFNADRVGFGALRVLNDDEVAPGHGFPTHPHENMEIITIVLEGALAHKDDAGGHGTIKPGEVQVMSAGTGVEHSEFNASKTEPVKLLQIWITPKQGGIKPGYGQKKFPSARNNLSVVASGVKDDKGLYINQDARISLGNFDAGKSIGYKLKKGNGLFVFVIKGEVEVEKDMLNERDSAEIFAADAVNITTAKESRVLLIEVPMSD